MSTMRADQPIGVFDSGVGGLTVFREIAAMLPHENLLYLGDTARVPYGNKSPAAIIRYTQECAAFLVEKNIKLLVIACHTASAHVLEILQEKLSIPVIGVIQGGFEILMQSTINQRVAILGTASTIASKTYQNLIKEHYPSAVIYPVACPLFVPIVEEHLFGHPAADLIAKHYLEHLKNEEIDAALLACTHYPLMRAAIQNVLGPRVKIIEPAAICAGQVKALLQDTNLLNLQNRQPLYHFFATDHLERFQHLAKTFLGQEVHSVLVHLEENSAKKPRDIS